MYLHTHMYFCLFLTAWCSCYHHKKLLMSMLMNMQGRMRVHTESVRSCSWSQNGHLLAVASFDGKVSIWNKTETGFEFWHFLKVLLKWQLHCHNHHLIVASTFSQLLLISVFCKYHYLFWGILPILGGLEMDVMLYLWKHFNLWAIYNLHSFCHI